MSDSIETLRYSRVTAPQKRWGKKIMLMIATGPPHRTPTDDQDCRVSISASFVRGVLSRGFSEVAAKTFRIPLRERTATLEFRPFRSRGAGFQFVFFLFFFIFLLV